MATRPDDLPDHFPVPTEPAPEMDPAHNDEPEVGGRGGLDPVRYGDWEKGGIAVDF